AYNNPVMYVDPSGHFPLGSIGTIIGTIINVVDTVKDALDGNKKKKSDGNSSNSNKNKSSNDHTDYSKPPAWLDWDGDGKVDSSEDMEEFDSNGDNIADWLQEETDENWILTEKGGWDHKNNTESDGGISAEDIRKEYTYLEQLYTEEERKELYTSEGIPNYEYFDNVAKLVESGEIENYRNIGGDIVDVEGYIIFDRISGKYRIQGKDTEELLLDELGENEETSEVERMTLSQDGLMMIANFEMSSEVLKSWGLGEYDDNGNLVGIYPHYVFKNVGTTENPIWISDGGITFGYGHYVNKNDYENSPSERALVDKYANGASILPPTTPSNGIAYKVPNSLAMSMEEVWSIFREDLAESEDAVNDFLITHNISLEQHQFDMLVSYTHNYGNYVWTLTGEKEKVLVKYFREVGGNFTAEGVMNAFESSSNPARRTQEAEIFINGYSK
ncbi:glycoside hydrolase family protein, partial [Lutispora sp.]|uniref:glycoside hydrolase family protein n=1 Tax=Lutispora sp. TaxID=2828727 RepID=UPI00356AA633